MASHVARSKERARAREVDEEIGVRMGPNARQEQPYPELSYHGLEDDAVGTKQSYCVCVVRMGKRRDGVATEVVEQGNTGTRSGCRMAQHGGLANEKLSQRGKKWR